MESVLDDKQPRYGYRLTTAVIDQRAAEGRAEPCVLIPRSTSLEDGYRRITYRVLANAINRCAHWLRKTVSSGYGETIAYDGAADLRYLLLAWGAVKSGHVMFFPSTRITPAMLKQLLDATDSRVFICSSTPSTAVQAIIHQRGMKLSAVPSLEQLLDEAEVEPMPYDDDFDQNRFKPFVKIHTSGSTGLPKVVDMKHGYVAASDATHLLDDDELGNRFGGMRVLAPFPMFHMGGLLHCIVTMLWLEGSIVLLPPGVPVTAEIVHTAIHTANVEHVHLPPSIINDLVLDPIWRAGLGRLRGITNAGSTISEYTAAIVRQHTKLYSSLCATEWGSIPMRTKPDEDWVYFRFNEEVAGVYFEQVQHMGLFEMVFRRAKQPYSDLIQAVFVTYPDVDVYRTKDCFSKHPTKPGLWKYETRIDSIIILSNGENVSTTPMEDHISTSSIVKSCLVIGHGRFQTAVLVERRDVLMSRDEALKALIPVIDEINLASPSFSRLAYDKVIFTKPEKPLPKTPKGNVQRHDAIELYLYEIEECYSRQTKRTRLIPSGRARISHSDRRLESSLLNYLQALLPPEKGRGIVVTDNFFDLGMDSLQVIQLVQSINFGRSESHEHVMPALIYNHPTVAELVPALNTSKKTNKSLGNDQDPTKIWLSMDDTFNALSSKGRNVQLPAKFSFSKLLRSSRPPPIFQPDGGMSAWSQIFGSFLINMSNWGLVYTFGAFQAYYSAELLRDHSPSEIAWIGTVQGALLLIVGVVSGPIFDKGYLRALQFVAGFGLTFGLMMLSLCTQYYQIMLTQGVLLGVCSGLLYIPSVAMIPLYFKRRRGLAIGLATSGGSAGGVVYPIMFRRLLDTVGFAWATRAMGFVTLVILIAAYCLIKPIGSRTTRRLFDPKALTDVPYLMFSITAFFSFCGLLVPFFLVSEFATLNLGLDDDLSFYVLGVLSAGQLMGRLLPAYLADWMGPETILLTTHITGVILAFSWIAVKDTAGYMVWLVAYGFITGEITVLSPIILPYLCPNLAVIGTRLGMLYAVAGIGLLISSPIALQLLQNAHGFIGPQAWLGACMVVSLFTYVVVARAARERRRTIDGDDHSQREFLLRKINSSRSR